MLQEKQKTSPGESDHVVEVFDLRFYCVDYSLTSLAMHIVNTLFNPERVFGSMIDRFESALDLLWYRSDNNRFPSNSVAFDEHKDPSEALAEEAIKLETSKTPVEA